MASTPVGSFSATLTRTAWCSATALGASPHTYEPGARRRLVGALVGTPPHGGLQFVEPHFDLLQLGQHLVVGGRSVAPGLLDQHRRHSSRDHREETDSVEHQDYADQAAADALGDD